MLVRIVKMSFKPEAVATFLTMFEAKKSNIRNRKGCKLLTLYRDKHNTDVFFTYSYWESEADLEAYRNSDLFTKVWAETKIHFNDKPLAWSVDTITSLP